MELQQKHAGIVLAAGASSRMGAPKALLENADGLPLALVQAKLLQAAPCEPVVVVIGGHMEDVASRLEASGVTLAYNRGWESGRLSSVQVGLRAAGNVRGAILLPVDTAGIAAHTLHAIRLAAESTRALALRPFYQGQAGHVVWLSQHLFADLLAHPVAPDFKLNEWLRGREMIMEMDDPNLLNNINTPAEWQAWQARYSCLSPPS